MNIYLDYNATAPLKVKVREAMMQLPLLPYNPSSIHAYGREARRLLEQAREQLLKAVGGQGYRLVFTGSGTEANNLAIKGMVGYTALVSAIEHVSVLKADEQAKRIPVRPDGIVDIAALERMLAETEGKKLVSVMLANNETGGIQPLQEIVAVARQYGAVVHSDAVQAFGKIPVDMEALRLDMLTISAHKCGGPQGIAALVVKRNLPVAAIIHGGGQELGYRAGTENIAAAVGFAAAIEERLEQEKEQERLRSLQQKLEAALQRCGAVIMGQEAPRLAATSSIAMPGVAAESQLIQFDLQSIALSSGSACSSGRMTVSHVLLAMGIPPELAASVVRVSMGTETSEGDIDQFIHIWKEIYRKNNDNTKA